jgi:hypothetical protein
MQNKKNQLRRLISIAYKLHLSHRIFFLINFNYKTYLIILVLY